MSDDGPTRRRYLSLLGTTGAIGLVGCTGSGDGGPSTATGTESDSRTRTASEASVVRVVARIRGLVAAIDADRRDAPSGSRLEASVADVLPAATTADVRVDESAGVVEVGADADVRDLVDVLRRAGYEVRRDDVRRGATAPTREWLVEAVTVRLERAGHEDAHAFLTEEGDERRFVVEVPGGQRSEIVDLLTNRGRVQIVASFPDETADGEMEQRQVTVATQGDFARVGDVRAGQAARPPAVPVTLTDEAATRLTDVVTDHGFTDEGVGNCRWQDDPEDPGYCLYTVVDGEVTYAAGLAPSLAAVFREDEFGQDPSFVMQTEDAERAERLKLTLEVGPLPTALSVDGDD